MTVDSATAPRTIPQNSFADDVRAGLAGSQKSLSPKYLYDPLGSILFEAITQLPEYGLWRAERDLFEQHAEAIARAVDAVSVVELGSGSASKSALLLRALLRRQPVTYWSVDLSVAALEMTRQQLTGLRGLAIHTLEADYLAGLETAVKATTGRTLVMLLGSALGNFDYLESQRFLQRVRRALKPGDGLLLGVDLEKPVAQMLASYDDALGVTAAFDLNLLVRMNRELGANFQLSQFRHQSRFNTKSRDVEMHLVSQMRQVVSFPGYGFSVSFDNGESIHTESSHKYSAEELATLTQQSGFQCAAQWLHDSSRFVSALCQAV